MNRPAVVLLALGVCVLAGAPGCGVPSAGGKADTFGLDFSIPPDAQRQGAVVFVVDGLNGRVFGEMLDAGKLPAIQRYFVDRGLYAPRAVAGTPSVTLANLTSLVTGQFPGHHGIVGINWFDRDELIWRNYETIAQKNTLDADYTAPTLYEYLRGELTFSIFFQPHRRATKFVENWTSAGPLFFFGWYEYIDRLTLSRLQIVTDVAREYRRFPAVTFVYLLAPDFRGYRRGVSSEAYRDAVVHTDRQIGRVLGDVERAGLLDEVLLMLVSDHGMDDVTTHFPLDEFLDTQAGLEIAGRRLWEKQPFEGRLKYYGRQTAVAYGSGDRYWALCLRKPVRKEGEVVGLEPWLDRPDGEDVRQYPTRHGLTDLPKVLCDQDAVDVVAYAPGRDCVRICRRHGEVELAQPQGRGGPIAYRVVSGADPLGWEGKVSAAALGGEPMTPRQWLGETMDTEYPDLPAQILAYFRSSRAGDLVVFAAPGFDFNTVNRAGHGGLRPADMFVPMLLAGPGVPHGRVDAARTVDLVPTLLKLLGRPVPESLDGQPLVP